MMSLVFGQGVFGVDRLDRDVLCVGVIIVGRVARDSLGVDRGIQYTWSWS